MSLYPTNETLPDGSVYPGVAANGKFTDGDASVGIKASHLPATTVNLIVDNIQAIIDGALGSSNSTNGEQLDSAVRRLLSNHTALTATADQEVHGIRQGAGNDFDADQLDGKHLSEIYTAALNAAWPVGASYVQFPGASAPAALGLPGTWAAQFEDEGIFFRTPGSHASQFGSGVQGDAMQRITGTLGRAYGASVGASATGAFRDLTTRGGGRGETARHDNFPASFDSSRSVYPTSAKTNDYETRPRNRTFRIWKRIT